MTFFLAKKGKTGCMRTQRPMYPALLFFYLVLLTLKAPALGAEPVFPLPFISRLDSRDDVFRQYISDVESSRRLLFSQRRNLPMTELLSSLTIYSYTPRQGENLISIAARCNIPYATIASLNRFSHAEDPLGTLLLLPSIPGIFIPETPGTDLEMLLVSTRAELDTRVGALLSIPGDAGIERFRFIPGDDFSPTERVFFLNRGFRFPLRDFRLTSPYGPRISPITGIQSYHEGLDLAAPEGSEVYAVRSGIVVDLGVDPVLGNYIIISHDNNWLSLYGHLSSVNVDLHSLVQSGGFIGRVGTSGLSTGPHLHFELSQDGRRRDPARLLGAFEGHQR